MVGEKIAKALWDTQSSIRMISKSGENKKLGYRYAQLEDYVYELHAHLIAYGVAVIATVEQVIDLPPRKDQQACRVQIKLTLLHQSGEELSILAWGEGQDHGDKAIYKAITGARKYGLACLFNLATSDDPERDTRTDEPPATVPKDPPQYERKPQAKAKQPTPQAEPADIPMGSKIKACLEHFRFESISQADLELWAGRHALAWDKDILMRLGELKDNPDELRQQIRQLKKEQSNVA